MPEFKGQPVARDSAPARAVAATFGRQPRPRSALGRLRRNRRAMASLRDHRQSRGQGRDRQPSRVPPDPARVQPRREVSIRQRSLATFDESPVLEGTSLDTACLNCHRFAANDPQRMSLGTRSSRFGKATLLAVGGQVTKLDAAFGYTAWHPSGRLAAYSTNQVRQFFHGARDEVRDVLDLERSVPVGPGDQGVCEAADQQRVLRVVAFLVEQLPRDRLQQQTPRRDVHPLLPEL